MTRHFAIIVVLMFATSGTTFAQRSGPLADALSARSVRLALPPAQAAAPAPVAQNQKRSHPIRKGFLIGSLVGLVVGIPIQKSEPCFNGHSCSNDAVMSFTLMGAGIGSVIGWMFVK